MKKAFTLILLLCMPAAAADLSGIWSGAFRAAGGDRDIPQLFILKQEKDKITGSGGPNSTEQYPIVNGTVAGDVVKFEVKTPEREFLYNLKGKDKTLRGSLVVKSSNDTRNAQVWLERTH